jgi:hypothetical protein
LDSQVEATGPGQPARPLRRREGRLGAGDGGVDEWAPALLLHRPPFGAGNGARVAHQVLLFLRSVGSREELGGTEELQHRRRFVLRGAARAQVALEGQEDHEGDQDAERTLDRRVHPDPAGAAIETARPCHAPDGEHGPDRSKRRKHDEAYGDRDSDAVLLADVGEPLAFSPPRAAARARLLTRVAVQARTATASCARAAASPSPTSSPTPG